jgi:hypothetical protein
MVAVRLDDTAIAYAAAKLDEAAGGIAGELHREALWEPVVFVPDFVDPLTLPELDEDAGWIDSQEGAAAELASYLMFLKKRDPRLQSLIFEDPFAAVSDLDYDGATSDDLLLLQGRVAYLKDIADITPDAIADWRAVAVSSLKLVYVSEASPAEIRELAEDDPADAFHRLAHTVRHVAMSAYDDESWLILRHEQVAHGDHDCADCDGDCGDPDCDCHGHSHGSGHDNDN